ncbi:hypothetical protein ECKG_02718 [Escherichia coli TA206]|nr:hypothetical protein ECKG_02718 [Escherichia coli TA206]
MLFCHKTSLIDTNQFICRLTFRNSYTVKLRRDVENPLKK